MIPFSDRPIVSVLMPTFNQAQFLPRALAALENQVHSDFELIACDDASTDETPDILRTFNVRTVTRGENGGTALAINDAAKLATGEFMTWVSSDNVMHRNWLSTLARHLVEFPDFGVVYSGYWRCEPKRIAVAQGAYKPDQLLLCENSYFGPSFLMRKEVWCSHRGQTAHDYDNWAG